MNDIGEIFVRLGIGLGMIVAAVIVSLLLKGVDRKFAAWLQARIGPPIRQPFWDVAKLLQKENVVPQRAVPWAFNWAPVLAFVGALVLLFYLPLGPTDGIVDGWMPLLGGYGDLILIVYLFAVPGLMMAIGGFSSGSPLSTVGAQREMVIMMSYEFPLAIVILTVSYRLTLVDGAGTAFSMANIVNVPLWNEVGALGVFGLILLAGVFFLIIPTALSKIPFDAPEAETEIGGGILAEYSGTNLALFYLADAVKTVAFTALAVALFFPYNLSPSLDLSFLGGSENVGIYIVDLLFWLLKIEVLYFLAVTVVRVGAARLKIDKLSWIYMVPISALSILGALLIYLDTLV